MDHRNQNPLTPVARDHGGAPSKPGWPLGRMPCGMTMIEACVSTAIVGVITAVVFTTMTREGRMATEQMIEMDMQGTLRRCTDALVDELTDVHLVALSAEARWVDYNKPLLSPVGTPVIIDGETVFGAWDANGTFHENWFYHLEAVDEVADGVYVSERDWGQDVDHSQSTAQSLLYFTPVRFELTTYRREKTEVSKFNAGVDAFENPRMAKGNARLKYSAVLDTFAADDTTNPTNPRTRCARTLAVRCFRDSTKRANAPWDKGEGIFYMRQTGKSATASPMKRANTYTDANAIGYLDGNDLPTVTTDQIYPDLTNAPLVYSRKYFEADSNAPVTQDIDTVNNIVDKAERGEDTINNRFWQRLRLILFVVSGGEQDKNSDGINDSMRTRLGLAGGRVLGVNRVICSQTLVHLTICDR